ncbi:MAG: LPP20 family lipoprotein [bacterium]
MKKYLLFTLLAMTLIMWNCGGSQPLPETEKNEIPEWFMTPPEDPNYFYAVTTSTSKDMQLAIDKATTDARAKIAQQVEIKIQGLQKKFDEEVGAGENTTLLQQFTQATKTVVNTSLTGSKVKEKKIYQDGKNWRAYVLLEYPIGAANTALMQQLQKQEELYTRFRSSQTFKELDEEMNKK